MSNEALEKAWTLMKQRYTGWDGNRTRERRGKCTKCNAKTMWDRCALDPRADDFDREPKYAFECPNFDYTE